MLIESPAFANGQDIPFKYTCEGQNINPPLMFIQVPKQAKSLVLIMDDPDVPKSSRPDGLWNHWLIWNMPPETKGIGEGMSPPGVQGRSTEGETGYQGPCPPQGQHRYFFKLYALDTLLDLDSAAALRKDILKAMQGHVLSQAELMGRYQRK